ncbi:PBECR4 domain-containing protein [Streptococcus suis]|uniref:PBECR4 domain-containing protein n=1 Tax=Streptococcus suis TaxID=1307 RepID=UPI0007694CB1|nr:PBECR4 domain-containing protein [Streptococcus suis]MDY7283190.1 PBECR4 domain-containing protein [Streptococcus suis]CYU67348.1 DNA primase (type) [Streptococcus suis]CYU76188.1 DNA primase (type) [Streptococcus suis]
MVFTKAQAKALSILEVAKSLGMDMERSSHKEYYWKEHDSFKINTVKNTWTWYSRTGKFGDTIDLVREIKGGSYRDAMTFLETGNFPEATIVEEERKHFRYTLAPYEQPFRKARSYLKQTRGLSDETIDFFLEKGVLAEASYRDRDGYVEDVLVFKFLDRNHHIVGASLQGLSSFPDRHEGKGYLKKIMYQSEGVAGLNVAIGSPKRLIVAEAPIDLMSYYELHKDELEDVCLVAMDGLKEGTLSRYAMEVLQERGAAKEVVLDYTQSKDVRQASNFLSETARLTNLFHDNNHQDFLTLAVDNDKAGQDFIDQLQEKKIPVVDGRPPLATNEKKMDWNAYLQLKKKGQLMEHQNKRLTQNKEVEPFRKETRNKTSKTAEEHYFDWFERMAATVQEHLHLSSPPKLASELEAIVEPFITTDLDRLFARRLSLALDTQRVESSQILSVHQAIDQLDRQINEQLQEKELQTSKIAEDYLLTAVRGDLPTLEELYSSAIFSDKPSVVEYLKDWSANTEEVQRVIDFLTQLDPVRRDWLTPVEYFLDDIRTSQLEEDIADEEEQQEQVATLDQKEKAPDRGQEPISNAGDLHRNPDSLGDISPRTASKPVVNESQPDFPVIAPLKFTTKGEWMSTLKPGYHVITDGELRRLNKFAPGLQATAQWYLNELAGSTITYLYQDRDGIGRLDVQFSDENFAHLTGISPKGTEMKQVVYDFANGQGDYGNIQVSHSIKDKSMVLPLLPDILSSQAFVFNDLSTVEKFHKIDLEQAIKTDDEDLLLAIRDVDGIGVPASIMRIKEKLSVELEGKEQVVLGVYRERDDIIEQLSIHPDYVKDGGQSMMTVLKNKQYETLSTSQTIEEEKKIPSLSSDRLHDEPALPVSIMDSDADGISDEEEKKQGSNPYDFRSQPATKHQEEREEQVVEDSSLVVANLIQNQDIAGLNRHLKDGIKEYLDSDKYKDYLTKMSQLNNYSSRNLRLILAQQPTASQVASFKQWKETFGRHVKKGEKALRIFVPITYIKKDENNQPILDKDGKPEIGTTFRLKAAVFDVSQTDGKEMPKAVSDVKDQLTDQDYGNLYRTLMTIAKNNHVSVRFEELEESRKGYYDTANHQIVLNKVGMNKSQLIKTFLHETAHSELHHKDHPQKDQLTRSTAELQAESVAYVVASYYGLDTSNYSFGYLASWSQDKDTLRDLEAQLDIVQQEAKSLIERMDKEMEVLRLSQVKQTQHQFENKLNHFKEQSDKQLKELQEKRQAEATSKKEKGISK